MLHRTSRETRRLTAWQCCQRSFRDLVRVLRIEPATNTGVQMPHGALWILEMLPFIDLMFPDRCNFLMRGLPSPFGFRLHRWHYTLRKDALLATTCAKPHNTLPNCALIEMLVASSDTASKKLREPKAFVSIAAQKRSVKALCILLTRLTANTPVGFVFSSLTLHTFRSCLRVVRTVLWNTRRLISSKKHVNGICSCLSRIAHLNVCGLIFFSAVYEMAPKTSRHKEQRGRVVANEVVLVGRRRHVALLLPGRLSRSENRKLRLNTKR